jgi:hypothetical protein
MLSRFTKKPSRLLTCAIVTIALLTLGGCGDSRRQGIQGTVTFDGRPIPDGYIKLLPKDGTHGPTAGANIKDGHFAIKPDKGTFVGVFRVEILASKQTGQMIVDAVTGEKTPSRQPYIPSKYNTQSELTAQIKEGQNDLKFELTSE